MKNMIKRRTFEFENCKENPKHWNKPVHLKFFLAVCAVPVISLLRGEILIPIYLLLFIRKYTEFCIFYDVLNDSLT